jgi:mono/diheme cytochrome c family protein
MLRKLFLWGNIILLVVFTTAIVQDLAGPYFPNHWAYYQKKYRQMQADEESNPDTKNAILSRPIEIKQMMINDLGQIDRCTSCHQGMDPIITPTMQNSFTENPYKSHPGTFLKDHQVDKFGCVICHGGQGIATTFLGAAHTPKDEAQKVEWKKKYGWRPTEHWERPMLAPPYIQASCAKCHGDFESLPGAEVAAKGKDLMDHHGCLGCHQWKGFGGPISVDLAEETANKPIGRIDFSHTGLNAEDMNLLNWIRLHFLKDPKEMTPGDPEAKYNTEPIAPSGMQNFTLPSPAYPDNGPELSQDDATALTTFILSGRSEKIPYNYYVAGPKEAKFEDMHFSSRAQAGKWVFDRYGCAACHGLNAKGGRFNFNYQGGGAEPVLVKTISNYTRDELRKKIEYGVPVVAKDNPKGPTPPLYMPAWKDKISPPEMEALMDYLYSIAEKQAEF